MAVAARTLRPHPNPRSLPKKSLPVTTMPLMLTYGQQNTARTELSRIRHTLALQDARARSERHSTIDPA